MTDKLKLADPNGDFELRQTVIALEFKERLRQMEQNVAALEKELAEKKKANAADRQRRAASANNKIGARKDASFKAISTAPSINLTPRGRGMVPVAYPVVQDLSGSVKASSTVRFNGKPAYLLDQTTQPSCVGDAPGSGGGVRSGTVGGEVKPVDGSRSVRIEGKRVVREGDACTMNGGNNPGIYVTVPLISPAPPRDAIKTSNPPVIKESQTYPAALRNIANAYEGDKIGLGDAVAMAWDNTKFHFAGSQAAQGLAQATGGALEVLGATGMALSGVGVAVGVPLAFHGGDNFGTGISRIIREEPQPTATYAGVQTLTGSANIARTVDNAIPFLGGVSSLAGAAGGGKLVQGATTEAGKGARVAAVPEQQIYLTGDGVKILKERSGQPSANIGANSVIQSGATFEGTLYRAVGEGYDPLLIHSGNIANSHRYTGPGQGGLYFATGEHVVAAEFLNNGSSLVGTQMHAFTNASVSNLLDISNPVVRESLGVSLGDLTRTGGTQAWRYEVTQPLGSWAQKNGYKGIIAPSAQANGGVNLIIFDGKWVK